jgi:secreted trypsin-like serine protease
MTNEQESIRDCPLKFYKYGEENLVKPASARPAVLRDFAHIAAIGWTESDGTISWNCGGSLVTETFILTAGHCTVDELDRQPDTARMGDLNLYSSDDDKTAQQYKIVEIIRHPDHSFRKRYNDLALMRIEKAVKCVLVFVYVF